MSTRRGLLLAAATLCVGLLGSVRAADAPLDRVVDVALRDTALPAVAAQLAAQTGARIVVEPALTDVKVSLDLHGVTLRLALQTLAEIAGITVGQTDQAIVLRPTGGAQLAPLPAVPPLSRTQVKKLRYECRNLTPTQLAATFGRPSVHHTGAGGGLEPAAPFHVELRHTILQRRENLAANETAWVDAALRTEDTRLTQRWDDLAAGKLVHPSCGAGVNVPPGILAVIGFDPSKSLIVVGTPAAVDRFAALAAELDVAAGAVELTARYFVVPTAKLAQVGLRWSSQATDTGTAAWRYAVGPLEAVSGELARAAVTQVFDGPTATVDNARAAVLSCCRVVSSPGEASAAAVASDLKVVPWQTQRGGQAVLRLSVEAPFGDVVVGLGAGEAGKLVVVPGNAATFTLATGQSLVVAGLLPKGDFRAVESGPLLSRLPLVGELYRTAGSESADSVVVAVITPRAK